MDKNQSGHFDNAKSIWRLRDPDEDNTGLVQNGTYIKNRLSQERSNDTPHHWLCTFVTKHLHMHKS